MDPPTPQNPNKLPDHQRKPSAPYVPPHKKALHTPLTPSRGGGADGDEGDDDAEDNSDTPISPFITNPHHTAPTTPLLPITMMNNSTYAQAYFGTTPTSSPSLPITTTPTTSIPAYGPSFFGATTPAFGSGGSPSSSRTTTPRGPPPQMPSFPPSPQPQPQTTSLPNQTCAHWTLQGTCPSHPCHRAHFFFPTLLPRAHRNGIKALPCSFQDSCLWPEDICGYAHYHHHDQQQQREGQTVMKEKVNVRIEEQKWKAGMYLQCRVCEFMVFVREGEREGEVGAVDKMEGHCEMAHGGGAAGEVALNGGGGGAGSGSRASSGRGMRDDETRASPFGGFGRNRRLEREWGNSYGQGLMDDEPRAPPPWHDVAGRGFGRGNGALVWGGSLGDLGSVRQGEYRRGSMA